MSSSIYNIILKPVVTEKSLQAQEVAKYTLIIPKNVSKIEVRKAIETIYGVKVDAVNKMNTPVKTRLVGRGRLINKRKEGVKVIVTLKKGQHIDLMKIKDK